MNQPAKSLEKRIVSWLLLILPLIGMAAMLLPYHFALGLASYLPLHTAVEAFSVVIAMLVFAVGINIHREKIAANQALLSCAFLAVGLLDFGHILSYSGMPDFVTPAGAEKAIYFWLAARGVSALALLAVAVLPWQREAGTRLQTICLVAALALSGVIYWLILFHQDSLPRVYDPATGLTPFKRGMEYLIVGVTALTALLVYRRKNLPQGCDPELLFVAIVIMGLGELFFTAYTAISDHMNLLGHIYKVIAYYLLYRAVVAYAIHQPYRLLFESEQRLRESEEYLARVLDGSADGFWDCDLSTGAVIYRGRWAEMLGYSLEEIAPHRDAWEPRIHPDDRDRVLKAHADYLAGFAPRYDVEFRMRAKSGDWRWIRSRGKITRRDGAGRALHISGAHTDITEKKMLAENLARLKRQNDLILTAAGEGICGVDTQGTIIFANPAAAEMLGFSVAELFGRSLHDTSHHTRPDGSAYPAEECPILASLNSGRTCHEGDEFYWRRDGGTFPVEYTSTPIIDEGKIIGAVVMFSDVTRRRQAEETLRRWRQFIEHATWGMAIGDFENRTISLANPAYARMHGYRTEEIVGTSAWELYAPESRTELPRLHEALKKNGYLNFECDRQRKDGSIFSATVDIAILYDAQGKAEGYIANVQDITERKRLEGALRDSEELFRTLFGGITDAILVHPISDDGVLGRFVVANNVACKWLGYSHQEMLGMTPRDIEAPDSSDPTPIARRVAAGESVTFERIFAARDGKRIPVELRVNPFLLQGRKAVITLARDITERKQAEQALLESEERYRSTFEQAAVGIAHAALDGRYLRLNRKFCEIVGYAREELMRMTFRELTYPDDLEEDLGYVRQALAGEINAFTTEKRYVRKDRTLVWVSLTVSLVRKSDGTPDYFIGVADDITGRKHAEQQLRELSAHLQTVREEEKASIAREIHDDLGGTLTALKMEAYWLARKLPPEKETAPLLEHVESMSGLLDDAVAVTRRIITELRPTILDDLGLSAALEWQCGQFQKRTGIGCRVICNEERGCEDDLDKTCSINLFRIFQEALTNISRHADASQVEVEFHHGDDEVVLWISDNGRGLPEGHAATPDSHGMRGMVERTEQLGGKIKFDSPPGGGLTVTVALPLPAKGQNAP